MKDVQATNEAQLFNFLRVIYAHLDTFPADHQNQPGFMQIWIHNTVHQCNSTV
jgi:hypothetical protein